jgi:Subtilase family/TIR domain
MVERGEGDKLNIFICYSREDIESADVIDAALEARGFGVAINRRDLPDYEWSKHQIRRSDTVLWLISQRSISSVTVNWELDEAAKHNKRLVSVTVDPAPFEKLPRRSGQIHLLFAEGVLDPARDLNELVQVLERDTAWLKEASRLQNHAEEWLTSNRRSMLLLSSRALDAALRWNELRPPTAPSPAKEVLELLLASREAARHRQRMWLGLAATVILFAFAVADLAYLKRIEISQIIASIKIPRVKNVRGPHIYDPEVITMGDKKVRDLKFLSTNTRGGESKWIKLIDWYYDLDYFPLIEKSSLLISFRRGVTGDMKHSYLSSHGLELIEDYPSINAVLVSTDLSRYFTPASNDRNENDYIERGIDMIRTDILHFENESFIEAIAPDMILFSYYDLELPRFKLSGKAASIPKQVNWGVRNIEADKIWDQLGAKDGVILGILDVGFSRHEDLVFIELPPKTPADDHGNHVAAIACGRHQNSIGMLGVLPNCLIRARTGDVFIKHPLGGSIERFGTLFSEVIGTLDKFIDSNDDIYTINISMGYNWSSNFKINIDSPESNKYRTMVEMQGAFLVSVLERADKKGIVFFSAAGNDSSGLKKPIDARYASPFNWAALAAREKGLAKNGFIVEAHNQDGTRADFSNVGGDISCPGVDILSAVAFDSQEQPSTNAYGLMSGTSMASPHCAAAHSLLRLVRRNISGKEAVACMLHSTVKSTSGVPILKLTEALKACP